VLTTPLLPRGLTTSCMIIVSLLVLLPLAGLFYQAMFVEAPLLASTSQTLPELWQRYNMGELLYRTLQLGFSVACFNVLLGCWLAWTTQRLRFMGRKVLALVSLIPLAIPSFIYAATLRDSLSPGGWLGELFALPVFTGFVPATLVLTLTTLPYTQLLLTTRLSSLAYQQEEAAARTLGANVREIFWKITWPYLRPAIVYAWLISFLYAISDFGAVAVLNYPVLTWHLYQAVEYQQLLLASLLGSLLLLISLPVFFGSRLLQSNKLQNVREKKHTWANLNLPKKYYPAIVLTYLFIIVMGVVVPLATMVQWVYQGWIMQLPFADIGSPLLATLILAIAGASIITLFAYFPAWVAARARHMIGNYLEQLVYLTSGLPSILVGFGLLLAALIISSWSDGWIYNALLTSGILLMLGYSLRFLPQAYAYLKTAILNLDDHQYASAKLLGASSFYWWRRLALPRLWISIRAAWIVVILSISKELPITLLLGNATGLQPLSVRMFDRYQEAFLYDAGLAGLVLVLLCIVLSAWTLRSSKGYLSG
jgi:iron(III) transport system permease protein